MNKFEKLKVWQESLVLVQKIYTLSGRLPRSEERNLIDQIKRSTVSVSLNIAEGSGAENDKEFKRYLNVGKKSITEVQATLKIIDFLYNIKVEEVETKALEILKMLNGLIKYLKRKSEN